MDVGPSRERQQVIQQINRGRITRQQDDGGELQKQMYGGGAVPNPMTMILRVVDTLELTGPQADSIATMNRRYVISLDSIWSPVAKYLAALPDSYNKDEAYSGISARAKRRSTC